MSFSPVARYKFRKLADISPEFLRRHGCALLMLDLDNTIAPYGARDVEPALAEWARRVKDGGTTLYIVSNTRKTERVQRFADALGIRYVNRARKPFPSVMRTVMRGLDVPPERAMMAGDQSYTDVIAANLCGAASILVRPIRLNNLFLLGRYVCELPFRRLSGRRNREA